MSCNVFFAPDDDLEELKVASGERSQSESCRLGCEDSDQVTVDRAACVDELTITTDPASCRDDVLSCLEVPPEPT